MHWQKSPKEKSCYPLPTVKKLLEQKRKRETGASGSAAPSVPTPVQAAQQGGAGGFSDSMGAAGPMTVPGFGLWSSPVPPHPSPSPSSSSPPQQRECLFSASDDSFFRCLPAPGSMDFSQTGPYTPPASSAYSGQHSLAETPYAGVLSIQFPSDTVTTTVSATGPMMASHPASYPWPPLAVGVPCPDPGHQGYGMQMDAEVLQQARMFLRGMDYSKKMWQDEDGDTILHIYTAKGLREYAYAAAEDLSVLGRLDSKEHKGKTALLVAVTANQPEIVHDLLQLGADVNACDVKGQTALHLAATYGFPQVMQAILSMGLNVDLEARNFEGLTPLHCAAISHGSTVKALCATPGLPDAALQNQAEDKLICVQLLLGCGASLLSQDIKSNKTVLHLAVKDGNLSLVQYLLGLSYHDMHTFVNMKAHGNTALHMAAGLHGHPYQEEMIQVLLGRGADPSVRNLENDQPAHLLQAGERGEQLKLILKKGRATSSRRRIVSS
ncbi:NF-kappa-B inhibitor delta isoform X2 [Lepisosteus oculatus]|uniref:NF-kappa-B inhibitor delta isoform X2 n=1 Tax=Lepisosteus oculatus TaxID=7918 RepID=UPI0007404377|nr:PREDICTED: NF-kappa-B inhibitor delta isoform X2 [Lepisosteus oculatus]